MALITGRITLDEVDLLEIDGNPSTGAGVSASIGTMAIVKGTFGIWQKYAAGNTAWAAILNTVTGILNYIVVSSTLFSTTSSTPVVVTGFSVTPAVTGTFAIWVSASWSCSNASAEMTASLFHDGTVISDSTRIYQSFGGSKLGPLNLMSIHQDLTNADPIDVRISTSAGTLSITNRALILIRLGD